MLEGLSPAAAGPHRKNAKNIKIDRKVFIVLSWGLEDESSNTLTLKYWTMEEVSSCNKHKILYIKISITRVSCDYRSGECHLAKCRGASTSYYNQYNDTNAALSTMTISITRLNCDYCSAECRYT
jgi:hypothetical protein